MREPLSAAEQRFQDCVPADQQSDVLTMMAEAAQGWAEHDAVDILERDRLDAINVRAHGIIRLGEEEYRFILQDGNWNGTVLEDWDGDTEFEPAPRTEWALQPTGNLVASAIEGRKGTFLIFKWDAVLKNQPRVAEIPGKYAYDRMMQPGGKVETYWKAEAAKAHFEIVSQDEADATRKRLQEAA